MRIRGEGRKNECEQTNMGGRGSERENKEEFREGRLRWRGEKGAMESEERGEY